MGSTNRHLITEEEAFAVYVQLPEAERSLDRLVEVVRDGYGAERAPSRATLGRWASGKGPARLPWRDRLATLHQSISSQVLAKIEEERVAIGFDLADRLMGICRTGVERIETILPLVQLEGELHEVTSLLNTVIAASTHIQLLTGNPTGITETRGGGTLAELSDDVLAERYKRYVASLPKAERIA